MADTHGSKGLLSPAPSDVLATHAVSDSLPIPRSHALAPGSAKETNLVNYIDDQILHINSRYAKSFAANAFDEGRDAGYTTFDQLVADVDPVVDVVWISATPAIQVPYLLALAGIFRDYMHSFHFVISAFSLVRKLDSAFSQLLLNHASSPQHVTMTDKVRIKSLAQETRFEMVDVASKSGHAVNDGSEDEDETDADDAFGGDRNADDQSVSMKLGKVYEKTLEILGADLSSLPPPEPHRHDAGLEPAEDVEIVDL